MSTRWMFIGISLLLLCGCNLDEAHQSSIDRCKDYRVQSTIESYKGFFDRGWFYRFDRTVCVTNEEKIAKP